MIEELITIALILLLLWQREWLRPFQNPQGRIILLGIVVYLARQNIVVGCLAALLMATGADSPAAFSQPPLIDLMRIGNLMRPRDSADSPSAWLTEVPRATSNYEFF